jgi:zinc transporter 9
MSVLLPRGIEALARSRPSTNTLDGSSIAIPLLFGFTFMLVVEQLSSSHTHHNQPHHARRPSQHALGLTSPPDSIFDVELAGLDDGTDGVPAHHERRASGGSVSATKTSVEGDSPSAYPITIGLVLHGLADGLALGMSVLSNDGSSSHPYALSMVVFMALAVHKGACTPSSGARAFPAWPSSCSLNRIAHFCAPAAPTALAYTVSLMSTTLSRVECKKHLILFSASTPVGAIASYASFSFFGSKHVDGVGTALLISVSFLVV